MVAFAILIDRSVLHIDDAIEFNNMTLLAITICGKCLTIFSNKKILNFQIV